MTALSRLAFIGNSLPRRCGIATFTTDLHHAVADARREIEVAIVAMTDHGQVYDYPPVVQLQINDQNPAEYENAADFLNAGQFDAVCLQHEFGIFGGEAGSHLLALLSRLTMPIVTTLHTVLAEPKPAQRAVMKRLVEVSAKIVVMAEKARELLRDVYSVPAERIEVVPHGIPDSAFLEPDEAKARLGFGGKSVILTFGLLSPNKGIEVMIDAMPSILQSRPDAVYVVLGATHPNLVRCEGEAYRERLMARVHALGLDDQVVFLDRFVDQRTLLDFISMCDVYVTPYLNEAQMTSGTLAYSFGLGKAVVSTPYWHARELLADGRGVLVPFGDATAIGAEIAHLLTDSARRDAMRRDAYSNSRSMTWERTAERYLSIFEKVRRTQRLKMIASQGDDSAPTESPPLPQMQLGHFLSMCDDTGLFQHAIHSVPDRSHGYCVDDNARALLVACALSNCGDHRMPEILTTRVAAFVQHAWNPDTRRFRNFMSFERRWLEDSGSEDSNGRTLWALGVCSRNDTSARRRRWATALFAEASSIAEDFRSPRAWAFTLLGLDAYCIAAPKDSRAASLRRLLADRLMSSLASAETKEWVWFEDGLAYDNARLPQALIATGLSASVPAYVAAGLRSLRWLMALQRTAAGHFRPVGSDSFGDKRRLPRSFDQQPLEAAAAISACLAAWRADGDSRWKSDAQRAFAWFLGGNDLAAPLADLETGGCRDGLHPDRVNENQGAESTVSYLLGLAEIRDLAHLGGNRTKPTQVRILRV
ncbi:glycosyltransferase family 4 protein [Povalibacter sp.]|uniref:glycosyltransferase family 4 protein n=1 Tax=Povalibacter sp. TaxID=1962978 RepID=UPI002F423837